MNINEGVNTLNVAMVAEVQPPPTFKFAIGTRLTLISAPTVPTLIVDGYSGSNNYIVSWLDAFGNPYDPHTTSKSYIELYYQAF